MVIRRIKFEVYEDDLSDIYILEHCLWRYWENQSLGLAKGEVWKCNSGKRPDS